ncbi:MAG: HsdR family type I site-specific deoxyribonuclease [Chloroflexi bacterium]|nr:HsdR family type I site-specific deoxyribonuclease [Chloroflexota bacterium]
MFNEANSVEEFILTDLRSLGWQVGQGRDLDRNIDDVLLNTELIEALIRLNPAIAARRDYADDVIYKLQAIIQSAHSDGLVRANEQFTKFLIDEPSMPFGVDQEHIPVKLIDFDNPANNSYIAAQQVTYKIGKTERRFDIVLFINGIPLVIGEAKTPTRDAISWVDGAIQIQQYEDRVPDFFVPNLFSFATEGKTYRYGAVRMPLDLWGTWRDEDSEPLPAGLDALHAAVEGMLHPDVILDMLRYFALFATHNQRKIKIIPRYQQYQGANKIVERVRLGTHLQQAMKGLIWHFQGSGKSLLMVFAAQKLRLDSTLRNPTVLVVVDRIDLDTQISGTFNAAEIPNTVTTEDRDELRRFLAQDTRKIIITTIYKFREPGGVLNDRRNIIVLVDEAHRTQEGNLGRQMRAALPNAFLFGLTGTPINKKERNTFWAFSEEDEPYLSRYSFEDSIRDEATLPLHFEARLIELRVDKDAIDEAYTQITGHLSEQDQAELAKMAAKMAVLIKTRERVQRIVVDIVGHYRDHIEPNGFKAMVVTFDREACVLYKAEMDKLLLREASDIVMTVNSGEDEYSSYKRAKNDEEQLLERFRDPADPLKFLIVTSKLLTGFDAPILQAMYLDKPLKEHNLLQAICRTNRIYARSSDRPAKTHGLIVDYIGVFDEVAKSVTIVDQEIERVVTKIEGLREKFIPALNKCLDYFPNVDRSIAGYEGLMAAQQCLPNNDVRDSFAADFLILSQLWEALSPDSLLSYYREDYRWLSQVYQSVKPPSGQGKLLWHALGAKTLELIHENVHVEAVRDDLDTLVMDAQFLEDLLSGKNPEQAKVLEFQLVARLRKQKDNPVFVALGKRLEDLKDRHERGLITSIEFLKVLLEIAKDTVRAEKSVEEAVVEREEQGMAALTELFNETRTASTPVMVERVVHEIDAIVRVVRFPGWQQTIKGKREVKQSLRTALQKYQLHKEQDLFDKAYGYIEEYY